MAAIDVVTPDDLERGEDTPGIVREVAFKTSNNIMIRAHAAGGTTSGWHHHGDRHVYGYLLNGVAAFEYESNGRERQELAAGDFMHIQPKTVHRDINPTEEEHVWLLNFVGTGPLVVNIDEPNPE
ncbi:cupin domain-containing protein [Haladaptatus sp. CMAA 1911]|uniref:cupin domain-containing protein n=1 Tax=unclassified Haladaptatus TaxID=2622732 RepID=UPI003754BED0